MSEALMDEVEAINSIYGADTLVASSSSEGGPIYVLALPGDDAASLRLQFPAAYPDAPPAVLGTHSAGGAGKKRGAAACDLALFRDAVAAVYEPGQVCLFDAIERLRELRGSAGEDGGREGNDEGAAGGEGEEEEDDEDEGSSDAKILLGEEPPWVVSEPVTELRSTFVARCARVSSPAQAAAFVRHLLASDRRVRVATHNITAWRIRGAGAGAGAATAYQDCDDDGETAAGGRLLHLMQLMDLWDVMVVVSRWYGGHKLGPRRFALINAVARDAFVKAGFVADGESSTARKKGHSK